MTTRISTTARTLMADALVDLLDGGSGPGVLEIRTGAQPASVGTTATGTLLATLTLSDPAFGSAVNGVATASAITSDFSADATGTAGWFRALDSNGAAVIDGSVSASGGGGDLILNDTAVVAGGTIAVSSWTFTQSAG